MTATASVVQRRRTPLIALLVGNTVSYVGSALTLVALPWFVLQTTGSVARTGLTGFSVAVPGFMVGIFGGALIDQWGYRRTSVTADLVSSVGIALVPALYLTVGLPFPVLLALVFLGSMLAVPGFTARRSLLPELAELSGIRLERVNAAFESCYELSLLLGPPFAGLLIAWLGASAVLWIDAATFLVSAAAVGLMVPAFTTQSETSARSSYRTQLSDGLRFLLNDPLLRTLTVSLALVNALEAPIFTVAAPVYASRTLHSATDLGLLVSAVGLGAFAGITAYGAIGHRVSRRTIWLVAFLATPGYYWALLVRPSLPVLLGAFFLVSLIWGPFNPMTVTLRHERIPAHLRGRVFATTSAVGRIAEPLGIVAGGFAIAAFGLGPTVLVLAIILQVAAVAMLFLPSLQTMDERRRAET